ncbi:MAG TPA: hypothetical protein VHU40_15020 [Polyangia bacterium]|nr:hypothetical protein [Polyangia bacterium]
MSAALFAACGGASDDGSLSVGSRDAGTGSDGASTDPFAAAPTCTSGLTWTRGNHGDEDMNPGRACIDCHSQEADAPKLTIAGTLYPTAHEPDLCDGVSDGSGAKIVILGADGATLTLSPNAAGNFRSQSKVVTPFRAKITYMGRERVMASAQTSGDCNSCHTQAGANSAPGRIVLP